MRQSWLIFSQATTVALAGYFVVATLKPQWLQGSLHPAPSLQMGTPGGKRPGYAEAARLAAPAVVSISASKPGQPLSEEEEAWLRYHGGSPDEDERDGPRGTGSGVIVSPEGYVLTNNHVVENASEILIQLSDGRETTAELIGTDPDTDLAVLRIRLPDLPVMRLGEADSLQVGDAVLAIGNPFNVGQTVTSGIVSALGRKQLGLSTFENFIQTDAAINPGNSGGALVDTQGQLLGINTAIYSRSGGSMGIGFAIPVGLAREVMEALIKQGQVSRGWVGVQTREITPEVLEAFHLPPLSGVMVSGVILKGPAELAGIKPGDVVLSVAGKRVQSPNELLTAVAALAPGSQAKLEVQRGQDRKAFVLKIGQRPRPKAEDNPN